MRIIKLLILRISKLTTIFLRPKLLRALFFNQVFAAVEHKYVLYTNKFNTIIDIGANRGQFSLAAREFTPAKIFSFEPLPLPCAVFKNVFKGDTNVTLFNVAISDVSGSMKLNVSARDDSSSLLEISESQYENFPGTHQVGSLNVEVGPLDSFIKRDDIVTPALLKLDVQGYELQALKGCASLFERFQCIYCECSFIELYKNQSLVHDVISHLNSFNYKLAGFYNPTFDNEGHCIQADLFFIRNC